MHVLHARFGKFYRSDCANVYRFFPVLLKLGKIKIVKYSNAIFWSILCDCKVYFSFWQHCSSCNINFPSIVTNKPQKWIHTIHRDTSIQSGHCNQEKSCSVRKCMVRITYRRWSVQLLHLVVLTKFPRWYYPRNLDPENMLKDNFSYEVSGYTA